MGDVLLVACGGGANSTVANAKDLLTSPMEILSRENATVPLDDPEELKRKMDGFRVIIPFSILGGEVGTDMTRMTISCAREKGCKVVSVLGLPPEMEIERREKALRIISDTVSQSDCSLIFDMQKTMDLNMELYKDRKYDFFLMMVDRVIMKSINSIVECLEGPFFTIFKERLYAFASYNEVLPSNAVMKAWDQTMFDNDTLKDSCIVLVSSHISSSEMDDIRNTIVREKGIMPEVVRRSDVEDSKVILFKAVRSF